MPEREKAITEMIDLVQQADQKVQEMGVKRRKRSKDRRRDLRRALRRALKK